MSTNEIIFFINIYKVKKILYIDKKKLLHILTKKHI